MMNVLMIKFRLSCTLHRLKHNKPHIYIKNKSMPLLLDGIRPFISSLFPYKLTVPFTNKRSVHNSSSSLVVVPAKSYANADILKTSTLRVEVRQAYIDG